MRTLYDDTTNAPTSPVMIMISSKTSVNKIVGHGSAAVSSKSRSRSGVVMTLDIVSMYMYLTCHKCSPVNVPHVENFAIGSAHTRVAPRKFDRNRSKSQVGSHGEVGDGSDHGDQSSNVVEGSMGTGLAERQANKGKRRNSHNCADSLRASVPDVKRYQVQEHTQYQSDPRVVMAISARAPFT